MSALAIIPNAIARARDEMCLTVLNCFEDGWTFGEIARAIPALTRNTALGIVHRVNQADPNALKRKPDTLREGPA